jgi:single-stranded DNA-binding protein
MSKFKGEVVFITPTTSVSDKFKKREVTLKSQDEYPQYVTFQLTQDKCDLANNLKAGDAVEVSYNLRGRKWEAQDGTIKYFNSIEAWTMSLSSSTESNLRHISPMSAVDKLRKTFDTTDESSDDLPF